MKRFNGLFEKLVSFEHLLKAAKNAQRGKRMDASVIQFNSELEKNILRLQKELMSNEYEPGDYTDFWVYDPKKRLVSAAPYRDRVVHHAIVQILEQIYEPIFIYDSYACRKGKGTHAAADRYTEFCRKSDYVLKCDISKYFENISHAKLYEIMTKKIKDRSFLQIIEKVIRSNDKRNNTLSGKGIPIGNLTSQYFANIYLNEFDHWIKDENKIKYYIRYMDDFVVLSKDKKYLWNLLEKMEAFLGQYELTIHPKKRAVFPVSEGCDFMGFRIWKDHRRLRPNTGYRSVRKLKRLAKRYERWKVDLKKVRLTIMSYVGHFKHADTLGLRKKIFRRLIFRRGMRHQTASVLSAGAVGTTTTTADARIATTTTRTTTTTTTASVLPARPTMPGFMSLCLNERIKSARRVYRLIPVHGNMTNIKPSPAILVEDFRKHCGRVLN